SIVRGFLKPRRISAKSGPAAGGGYVLRNAPQVKMWPANRRIPRRQYDTTGMDQIQWLEGSPQAIDHANFAKQFLMPPVMSASPPAVVMAVTPAPAPMMAMTANLNKTGAVGSTKVVGTCNRHRGGRQDPCDGRTNNNQAHSRFHFRS